jgi:hypothetical protein
MSDNAEEKMSQDMYSTDAYPSAWSVKIVVACFDSPEDKMPCF